MSGPPPKDPRVRQRRNKKTEAAELVAPAPGDVRIPVLPNPDRRKFHRLTRSWWRNLWHSPAAPRYLTTDADGLGFMAILVDDFYHAGSSEIRRQLAAEIRQWGARYGLSNWDRNRMNWTVSENPDTRPARQSPADSSGADPRKVLKFSK